MLSKKTPNRLKSKKVTIQGIEYTELKRKEWGRGFFPVWLYSLDSGKTWGCTRLEAAYKAGIYK